MELKYGIVRTFAVGSVFLMAGLFLGVIAITHDDLSQIRFIGFLAIFFGQTGVAAVLFALSAICSLAGLRAISMAFGGTPAAKITPRGIEVRSMYYSGLLKWADVASVQLRVPPMNSKACWLTFVPKTEFSPWVKLGGMSENLIIGTQLLGHSDQEIESWVVSANQRQAEPSRKASQSEDRNAPAMPGIAPRSRGFGRKVV